MASLLDNLLTRQAAIGELLANVAGRTGSFRADESGGKSLMTYEEYRLQLYKELDEIRKQIAYAQGPFEFNSIGF